MVSTPRENKEEVNNKCFCCKFCGSESFIKYGKKNNIQNYMCKDCGRKFVNNTHFERMKANPKLICLVLDLYFKGVSLRKIADHLKQFHELKLSHVSILRWIEKYVEIMDKYVSQFKPKTSDIWNADETMINIHGDWFYLWNVIDDESRFHLASVISKQRRIKDAQRVFKDAKKHSHNQRPKFLVTDGLPSYKKSIWKEFNTKKQETIHVGNTGIQGKKFRGLNFDNNLVERLQGTIKDRNKTQRGLDKEDSMFIKGHQLYYNFIRPHEGLNGDTPAHFANIYLGLGEKKWENLLNKSLNEEALV